MPANEAMQKPFHARVVERVRDDLTAAEARWEDEGGANVRDDQAALREADELDLTRGPEHIGLGLQGGDETGSRGNKSSTFDHSGDGGSG
jgi:hypothetical protein